ncbi:transposon Tf2-1 polyprotein isoform X1 [Cucumis melo var. makuwa]|uniref:Transposon Tf2-1 polyprotein isoform X1 n=1 Tax=Cucumis melo var. makuwa TaxID=1194695 RepID=A0A5D3D4P8_CUCMM|nr:transposon Tf2-1 polyprotein isoform X1 [Cucumis melo var. makuwa]TYK18500.1 transposon Tf2-1 polyprotein isoform X1 [Cucumis melo var. makuwa]
MLMKNLDRLSTQSDKQQHQKEENETTIDESLDESKKKAKAEQAQAANRSKFKKVEMPVFSGTDTDSWLFRANQYFQIHKLSDSEKPTVSVISFDGSALD